MLPRGDGDRQAAALQFEDARTGAFQDDFVTQDSWAEYYSAFAA
jgi:hypothetical protein